MSVLATEIERNACILKMAFGQDNTYLKADQYNLLSNTFYLDSVSLEYCTNITT